MWFQNKNWISRDCCYFSTNSMYVFIKTQKFARPFGHALF